MESISDQTDVIVDPNADTIIILKYQDTNIAKWDESAEFPHPPFVLPDTYQTETVGADTEMKETEEQDASIDAQVEDADCNPQDTRETRFHVSSRHLSLASTYFHRLLSQNWDHHPRDAQNRFLLYEVGWNAAAFARLMYIIHGKARAVPRTLELADLAQMAHMVDYYDCGEVVEAYSAGWMSYVKGKHKTPRAYGKKLVLWLWITWTFGDKDIFKRVTLIAMSESQSEIQTMGLPIPEIVVNAIEAKRQSTVHQILTSINDHLTELLEGKAGCDFTCASVHLGFFTKALHIRALRDPPCAHPYLGISIDMLIQHLREVESPLWCAGNASTDKSSSHCRNHACKEQRFLTNLATKMEKSVVGLKLKDFPSQQGRLV